MPGPMDFQMITHFGTGVSLMKGGKRGQIFVNNTSPVACSLKKSVSEALGTAEKRLPLSQVNKERAVRRRYPESPGLFSV